MLLGHIVLAVRILSSTIFYLAEHSCQNQRHIALPLLACLSAGWTSGHWAGRRSSSPLAGQAAAPAFPAGSFASRCIFFPSLPDPSKLWEREATNCVPFLERASKHGFAPIFREEEEGHREVMTCLGLHRMSAAGQKQGPTLWTVNSTSTFIHQTILPSSLHWRIETILEKNKEIK